MKKFLASIAFLAIIIGCATIGIKHKELTAQYYRTYETKTHIITEAFNPAQDYYWIEKENSNGDNTKVHLAWIDSWNNIIGVVFNDVDKPDEYNYCGALFFTTKLDMEDFLNKFDTSKIENGRNIPCGVFNQILQKELNRSPVARKDVAKN